MAIIDLEGSHLLTFNFCYAIKSDAIENRGLKKYRF